MQAPARLIFLLRHRVQLLWWRRVWVVECCFAWFEVVCVRLICFRLPDERYVALRLFSLGFAHYRGLNNYLYFWGRVLNIVIV